MVSKHEQARRGFLEALSRALEEPTPVYAIETQVFWRDRRTSAGAVVALRMATKPSRL